MMTFRPSLAPGWPRAESGPMSFAEDSHVRIFLSMEKEPDCLALDLAFGQNTSGSFANYDQTTSSWRTSQRSLFEDWSAFSGTWPRSGMMRNGVVFRRHSMAGSNLGIGSGLYPTPRASRRGARNPVTAIAALERNGRKKFQRLEDMLTVEEGMTGVPNPMFVEWLMGYPLMWTECPCLGTPSIQKSLKQSGARSPRRKKGKTNG
jgi:hypothetical protein